MEVIIGLAAGKNNFVWLRPKLGSGFHHGGSTCVSLGVVKVARRVICPPRDDITQKKVTKRYFHSSMTIFEFFYVGT